MRWLALGGALLLAGCGCQHQGMRADVLSKVDEVQFVAEHVRERVKLSDITVPDKWYLNICAKDDCDTFTLLHPPWSWQQAGALVNATWRLTSWCEWQIVTIATPQ